MVKKNSIPQLNLFNLQMMLNDVQSRSDRCRVADLARDETMNEGSKPGLLRLPDELLLKVAGNLNGKTRSSSLKHMALAHSRLRGVAQETLFRKTFVKPENIWALVTTALARPVFAEMITKLHIFQPNGLKQFDDRTNNQQLTRRGFDYCRNAVRKGFPDVDPQDWQTLLETSGGSFWVALLVLLALASNLKGLAVEEWLHNALAIFPGVFDDRVWVSDPPASSWQRMVRELLQSKLVSVDLRDCGSYTRFDRFEKLTHLSISAHGLPERFGSYRETRPTRPRNVLPISLQHLDLYESGIELIDDHAVIRWLSALLHDVEHFHSLKQVRVLFDYGFQEFMEDCYDLEVTNQDAEQLSKLIRDSKDSHVSLKTCFLLDGRPHEWHDDCDLFYSGFKYEPQCMPSSLGKDPSHHYVLTEIVNDTRTW